MQAISLFKAANIETPFIPESENITNVCCDSRKINPGDLFVAIPGEYALHYAGKAIKAGAKIIVAEESICNQLNSLHQTTFFVPFSNPRLALSKLMNSFYNQQPDMIVAVTGTNGKSSIVNMVRQFWHAHGEKSASLGSLGLVINPDFLNTKELDLPKLNSLDPINFHKTLDYLKKNEVNRLAMEASSHGLDQARLHSAHLTAAGFTNLTQDHLDYHLTMEEYFAAKSKLFSEILPEGKTAVLNADSPYFFKLKELCKNRNQEIISYSIKQSTDLAAENIRPTEQSIYFDLRVDGQLVRDQLLPLVGYFQLENLLCSIGLALATGVPLSTILSTLPTLKGVAGRMEHVGSKGTAPIFVDYAHTPDALESVLKSLKPHTKGKLSVVFGCGGDRDAGKRPIMGEIAQRLADKIIVTDDNPRFESPSNIRQAIMKACPSAKEIGNRGEAIAVAIAELKADDVLLIAGKGHESGQDLGEKILPFSDQEEVLKHITRSTNNMALWTAKDITQALNLVATSSDFTATGISIDTRTLKQGDIYVAIKGESLDGHNYVEDAFAKGAAAVIVSDPLNLSQQSHTYFLVDDTLQALADLGKYARSKSNAKIIAITGSAGKTTTKEWLYQVLNSFGETAFSPASFNNQWGVPLSLTSLDKTTQYGVFELGTNFPGEIAPLAKMVNPDIAIITTITEAHIGRLGTIEAITTEKSEIFSGLKANGIAIINADIPQFEYLAKAARAKGATQVYGVGKNASAYTKLVSYEVNSDEISSLITAEIKGIKVQFKLPFIGEHYALNSLVILTCVDVLGLSLDKAINVLSSLQPVKGRGLQHTLKLIDGSTFTLIDDAYNANPTSMKAGLSVLESIKTTGKKIAVLGEMLELGEKSAEYHKGLLPSLIAAKVDTVFATGCEMEHLFNVLPSNLQGKYELTADALISHVIAQIQHGDVVFVKGSKGSKVSKVVDYLLSQPSMVAA